MSQIRKNPVSGRWVVVDADRSRKLKELLRPSIPPEKDKDCCYCEGREQETPPEILAVRDQEGTPNSVGWRVRVLPHRTPALHVEGEVDRQGVGMFDMMNGIGAHELILENPRHDLDMASMRVEDIECVLQVYKHRIENLRKDMRLRYILVFKSHQTQGNATISHPHSQILATPMTPGQIKIELRNCKDYYSYKQRCLFCDIVREELEMGERIAVETDNYIAFEAFGSQFPFETWIMPKAHQSDFVSLPEGQQTRDLAQILRDCLRLMKHALSNPAYNLVLHTVPNKFPQQGYWETIDEDYHWHFELVPQVGTLGGLQRGSGLCINPVLPEQAASFLRELNSSNCHQLKEKK